MRCFVKKKCKNCQMLGYPPSDTHDLRKLNGKSTLLKFLGQTFGLFASMS